MDIVYGPVNSRRFGTCLGINLLGDQKVCSFNCVYCDLGESSLTMNRIRKDYEFPQLERLRAAFKEYIRKSVTTDAIVVSGNGEPTLYPDFDEAMKLVCHLRDEHLPGKKIIVLTNGAHLDSKKVVAGLNLADERMVKVDAGNDTCLQKINNPLIRLNVAKFLSGFAKLKDCIVQSMFVKGCVDNTTSDMVDDWIEVLGMVKPKHVQIYTLTRPVPPWDVTKTAFDILATPLEAVDEDGLYSIAFKLKKRTSLEATVFGIQKNDGA